MRVVHIFNSGVVSGPEKLVIPALAHWNHNASILFLREARQASGHIPPQWARTLGISVDEILVKGRYDRAAIRSLSKWLSDNKVDVVHTHEVKASFYTSAAIKHFAVRPIFCATHHGTAARPNLITRLYEKVFVHHILPQVDAVIAVSNSDKQNLVKRGLPHHKVHVHLNGISLPSVSWEQKEPLKHAAHRAWGISSKLSDKTCVLGIVGRLSEEKNHARLFEICKTLKQECPDAPWHLVVIGNGALENSLIAITQNLKISDHVTFLGYREKIFEEMPGIDIMVNTSKGEGISIAILEAGHSSIPVFASAVGGTPEVIEDNKTGVLFGLQESNSNIAAKLNFLITSPVDRERLARGLNQSVLERFSEKAWLTSLGELYESLVEQKHEKGYQH